MTRAPRFYRLRRRIAAAILRLAAIVAGAGCSGPTVPWFLRDPKGPTPAHDPDLSIDGPASADQHRFAARRPLDAGADGAR